MYDEQISENTAIQLFKSGFWKYLNYRQKAEFQINTRRLCMPFEIFHEAIEKTLNRPVYIHELGLNRRELEKELAGKKKPPSLSEIINLLPKDKQVIFITQEKDSTTI